MEVHNARYVYNKQLRPQKKRKNRVVALVLSTLLILASGYVLFALQKETPQLVVTLQPAPGLASEATPMYWPQTGQAAIGSLSTGTLATSSADTTPKPIASMTKLITALAVLEKAPIALGQQGINYTLTKDDEALYRLYLEKNGSVIPVKAGDNLTEQQALQALLILSANNIADMLARTHFGSVEGYTAYANAMVKDWGLTTTTISDASGFSPQTTSTPSDMIVIAQKVLGNPVLAAIVSQTEATLPGVGLVKNTNKLLAEPGAIGIKTGLTDEAGYCLVFASTRQITEDYKETVIGVLMGQKSSAALFSEAKLVLDGAYQNFAKRTVLVAGSSVGEVRSLWNEQTKIVTKEDLFVNGWKGTEVMTTLAAQPEKLTTVVVGQRIGELTLEKAGVTLEVVAESAIYEPSVIWKLLNLF